MPGEPTQLRGPKRLYARVVPILVLVRQRWWQARRALHAPPSPETFTGKVRYKMAFDRRPLLTTFADKLASRDYVEAVLGPGFLPDLYLATDRPEEIRRDALPADEQAKFAPRAEATVVTGALDPRAEEATPARAA